MRIATASLCAVLLVVTGCTSTGRSRAVEGAAVGAVAGAVGGLVTAAIFGGNAGRAAARGAAWGASTGAVAGGIRGDMEEEAAAQRRQEMDRRQEEAEIARLRAEIGDDNLRGLDALANCKYEVALAYAKTAQRSPQPEFSLSGWWLEALIYADQGSRRKAEDLRARLVSADSEIRSVDEADAVLWELLQGLRDVRVQYGMPATCPR